MNFKILALAAAVASASSHASAFQISIGGHKIVDTRKGGVIGNLVEAGCGGCGAGKAIDKKNKEIKDSNPGYKATEETASKQVRQVAKGAETIAVDTVNMADKALKDIDRERLNAQKEVEGAVKAAASFSENQLNSLGESLKNAEKRIREGKLVDAVFHIGTDQFQHASSNAARAVQESSLLNQVATAAASCYGGPNGAAAYAAWLTYETTGDLEASLKAGALAAASSYANEYADGLEGVKLSPEMRRQVAQFSVNGAAIAASGGSQQDILDALTAQATSAATAEVQALGQQWLEQEVVPHVTDAQQLAEAPKNWEQMSVIDKAKKVKASMEAFEADFQETVFEHTGIDTGTITLSQLSE